MFKIIFYKMDSFEINKIVAAILMVALLVIGIGKLSDIIFHVEKPKSPGYVVKVEEGKSYSWCSCGKSTNQPFCDSSEISCEEKAVDYSSNSTKDVYFCGCKETANSPICDCNS